MEAVSISPTPGLVHVPSLKGAGAHNVFNLWDGIVGGEYFPPLEGTAFYFLTLSKEVAVDAEVEPCKQGLVQALTSLSQVWEFSGGCRMPLENITTGVSQAYSENSAEVKRRMLASRGMKTVTSSFTANAEIAGTYDQMPLKRAIELGRQVRSSDDLGSLFRYFDNARSMKENWFVELYKIKDVLERALGKQAKSVLELSDDDWSFFETVLNNHDLRHPGNRIDIEPVEVERVIQIGRNWVSSYISYKKI